MKSPHVFPLAAATGGLLNGEFGLTKRELFAVMAMQALVSNPKHLFQAPDKLRTWLRGELVAHWAVRYADFLIKELEKEE